MKSVQDTLYNWLTIKVVCDARPDDTAARDTLNLYEEMIADLHLSNIEVTKDDVMYYVSYQYGEETKKTRYPQELIEVMLNQINQEPEKYENYPIEEEE
jgi:predicted helicase